jgi:hypothetical protein
MVLNALHMRFALIGLGVVGLGCYLLFGGSLGSPEIIQLDFSMYPEVLEGCDVEIDGKVVGRLERYGQAMRSGFKVKQGKHVVRVLHDEYESQSIEVDVSKPGEKARLMLDMIERYDEQGTAKTLIGAL